MINGREYEFEDITLILGGRDVLGIRAIKYVKKQDKELLHGKGNKALSIQKGNITCDGEMGLTQSEYLGLKDLGGGSVLNLSLNAVVAYGDPSKGEAMRTDTIVGLQFTEEATEWKQGDKNTEYNLPFLALDIK